MSDRVIYTSSGEIFREEDIKSLPVIGKGMFGNIYRYGEDKVIKLMDEPDKICDYETLDKIRKLNLPNFYHIYELLSEGVSLKQYIGNIASYHESEDVDIWELPSEWLIENYEGLYETAIKLSELGIVMYDNRQANCILNSSGITLIDADNYYDSSDYEHNYKRELNLRVLHYYLLWPLLVENFNSHHSLREFREYKHLPSWLSKGFYKLFVRKSDKTIKELISYSRKDEKKFVKVLSRYPKPIDYFKDRIKK